MGPFLYVALTGLGLWLGIAPVPAASQSLPPDLTLGDLPSFQQSGFIAAPPDALSLLGYDPSRLWQIGDHPADILQLGDLQAVLDFEELTLAQVAAPAGVALEQIPLSAVEMLAWQTIQDLVQAIPELEHLPVAAVPPLAAVLPDQQMLVLSDLLERSPQLQQLRLGDLPLSQSSVTAIPGLAQTPLTRFDDWQRSSVLGVPGLDTVPLTQLAPAGVGIPSRVDIVFGAAEQNRQQTVSGSYEEGFQVPCLQNCRHLELGEPFPGGQWISGLSQQVHGGHGLLGAVNDGYEPTGRHPFGPAFKVVVLEMDEASGTATTGLYFRMCIEKAFVDLGCTPYVIGPIPWLPVEENGWIML